MGKIVLNDFKGVNTSSAQLAMKPGEAQNLQNVRNRPYHNLAKRQGVATALVETGPINGIFDLEFDNVVIPCYQVGGTLHFFPSFPIITTDGATQIVPDPFPYEPLDDTASNVFLLAVEPTMRAVAERYGRVGLALSGGDRWASRLYDSAGGSISEVPATQDVASYSNGTGTLSMPVDGFYQHDLFWHDILNGNPVGTRAAVLVNQIVTRISTIASQYVTVDSSLSPEIDGETSISAYTSSTIWTTGTAPTATASNFRYVLRLCRQSVRRLKATYVTCTQTNLSLRETSADGASLADAQACVALHAGSTSYGTYHTYNVGCVSAGPAPSSWSSILLVYNSVGSAPSAFSWNNKGTLTADLSTYSGGTTKLFLQLENGSGVSVAGGSEDFQFGQSRPTSGAVNTYAEWTSQSPAVGGSWTSATVTHSDTLPTAYGTGAADSESSGWIITDAVVQVTFTFTYNV